MDGQAVHGVRGDGVGQFDSERESTMRGSQWVGWLCAGAVLAVTSAAAAGGDRRAATPPPASHDDDYSYVFDDDPMQAGVMTADDPRIRVVAHGTKQLLIRPRTAFVPELLKTVENM